MATAEMSGNERDLEGAAAGDELDFVTFQKHLGTMFTVRVEGARVPLRLVEVTEGRTGGGFRRFSVLFHGPPEPVLPQGTYELHHDVLGSPAIFVVPIFGSNAERIVYEACFSRPVAA